jgi:hypothetical protein
MNSFPQYFTDDEIYISAYYDPHLLPDYGGELFQHQQAQLVQRDVRDKDNHLIPPWKYYEELRPSTLVLINATFHIYSFQKEARTSQVCTQLHFLTSN